MLDLSLFKCPKSHVQPDWSNCLLLCVKQDGHRAVQIKKAHHDCSSLYNIEDFSAYWCSTELNCKRFLLAILKSRFHDASTLGGLNEAIVMLNKWKVTITFFPKLLCSFLVECVFTLVLLHSIKKEWVCIVNKIQRYFKWGAIVSCD